MTLHAGGESGSGADFYRVVLDEQGNQRRLDLLWRQIVVVFQLGAVCLVTRMTEVVLRL